MITPDQIRAARALKGWSQGELAARTGLAVPTIANIEIGKQEPSVKTIQKIMDAFHISGIRFTPRGVDKDDNAVTILRGYPIYQHILHDALSTLTEGEEILLIGSDDKRSHPEAVALINELSNRKIRRRNIIQEQNYFILGEPENSRWLSNKYFHFKDACTIYGNKVAVVVPTKHFEEHMMIIIENEHLADDHRIMFEFMWDHSKPMPSHIDIKDYKHPVLTNYTQVDLEQITKDHLKKKKAGT